MTTGGELLIACLEAQGTDRAFCVPGESYLAVLDGLHDSSIEAVVARQEGGAAMMAEADGKLTGRPGICFVTRGPGATNAASGIHVARQDSTPLVMFVGQIGRDMRGRDAFQEIDFTDMFNGVAKLALQIESADRIPEIVSRAFAVALQGRPGPVVVALPEDMLRDTTDAAPCNPVVPAHPAPSRADISAAHELLFEAERPVVILGGSAWDAGSAARVQNWSLALGLPVAVQFRRQQLVHADQPNYAGDLGIGGNPALRTLIDESDLDILLGGRMSEIPSQDFTLLEIPNPSTRLIHVHPGAEELQRIYAPTLAINSTPGEFLIAWGEPPTRTLPDRVRQAHTDYLAWSEPAPQQSRWVDLGTVIRELREHLPASAILTNGAGNYSGWLHRFFRFRGYGTQVAPTSGSMGYGLPAAVAAKLRRPEAPVVCLAGDGCFQMTAQELGTAVQAEANIIVLVIDNGTYGTIRMHQERNYPRRVSATDLVNPDFAALGAAYGMFTRRVETDAAFVPALEEALNAGRPALLHIRTDPEILTPTTTISELRGD